LVVTFESTVGRNIDVEDEYVCTPQWPRPRLGSSLEIGPSRWRKKATLNIPNSEEHFNCFPSRYPWCSGTFR
jgi:hypothetical protein